MTTESGEDVAETSGASSSRSRKELRRCRQSSPRPEVIFGRRMGTRQSLPDVTSSRLRIDSNAELGTWKKPNEGELLEKYAMS